MNSNIKTFLYLAVTTLILVSNTLNSAANEKVVRVYFLVGQSNMEGKGNPIHLDTYKNDPMIEQTYDRLKNGEGWSVRDDVFITYPTKSKGAKHGPLTVGYGTKGEDSIGPEFGFGHEIGDLTEDPVLLIKIAWGGKSVAVDFRPPSAPPSEEEIQSMLERAKKKKPKTTVDEIKARFGHYYREVVKHAKNELAQMETKFPKLKGHKPVVSGFIWHQGFNDKVNGALREKKYTPYTEYLSVFIDDIRRDLGQPYMPFVIGELSTGGIPSRGDFQLAQQKVAMRKAKQKVAFVKTAEYYDTKAHELYKKNYWKGTDEQKVEWRKVGNDRPYHYLGSGKTYYLKGVAFAKQVAKMQK